MVALPRRRRRGAIPSADVAALRPIARRTTRIRLALAVALVAALVAAFLAARSLQAREAAFVASGTSGILVLDVSQSIDERSHRRTARTLERLADSNTRIGVILFSDTAYELLPPGSSGAELRALMPFFARRPTGDRRNELGQVTAVSPWSAFSGGTQISTGLRLARDVFQRDGISNGSVVLVSDLDTAPADENLLAQALLDVTAEGFPVRVVPLFPIREDLALFERVLGKEAIVTPAELRGETAPAAQRRLAGAVPAALAALAVLLALLVAANERWCGRLEVPHVAREEPQPA